MKRCMFARAATAAFVAFSTTAFAEPLVSDEQRDVNRAAGRAIIAQSTTSTQNSGLYAHILPVFEEASGIRVDVVAVGTGQALNNARNCDGDILIVHAREAEDAFVAEGYGSRRSDLMFNDFVLVGPEGDPVGISGETSATAALGSIAAAGERTGRAIFASRGDDSGTHKREVALWSTAGIDPGPASGTWYRETGSGMGTTLNIAVEMDAYTLVDRATWSRHANTDGHVIVVEGDPELHNQYGVVAINAERCPNIDADAAALFEDWLLSEPGQEAIASFSAGGARLFTPNARNEPEGGTAGD